MKQMQISRKPRKHSGHDDLPADLLPTKPCADTARAAATVSRIDAALADR